MGSENDSLYKEFGINIMWWTPKLNNIVYASSYLSTCNACGKRWKINCTKVTVRDKDKLYCKCGAVLISWNCAKVYSAEEVKEN